MRCGRAGSPARRAVPIGLAFVLLVFMIHPMDLAKAGPWVPDGAVEAIVAEILGGGTVRLAFVTSRGQVVLRWESAAYAPALDAASARAALRFEASRVTGALFNSFSWIPAIHFTIVHRDAVLATGEHLRGRTMTIFFSSLLAL